MNELIDDAEDDALKALKIRRPNARQRRKDGRQREQQ